MSEIHERLQAYFRGGLSTAETLSDISGRGIGMAAVDRLIDSRLLSVRICVKRHGKRGKFVLPASITDKITLTAIQIATTTTLIPIKVNLTLCGRFSGGMLFGSLDIRKNSCFHLALAEERQERYQKATLRGTF